MTVYEKIKKLDIVGLRDMERNFGMCSPGEDWRSCGDRLLSHVAPAIQNVGKIYKALADRLDDIT